MEDFMNALEEIRPAFGMDDIGIDSRLRGGFINFSPKFN